MNEEDMNPEEVLFRQIHPDFLINGEPSSAAFRPNSDDQDLMSVDRSKLTTAEAAYALYVAAERKSAAVYGLSVADFGTEQVSCRPDPRDGNDGQAINAAHALADYSVHSDGKQKNVAKRLKKRAIDNGCLFP